MKTWHLIVIGGVVLYLWSRRSAEQADRGTPLPTQVTGIASSTVGLEPRSAPPIIVTTVSTGINVGAGARMGMPRLAGNRWPPIYSETATAWGGK